MRLVFRFAPVLVATLVAVLAALALGFGPRVASADSGLPCAKHKGVAYAVSGIDGGRVWVHIRCKDGTWEEYWY